MLIFSPKSWGYKKDREKQKKKEEGMEEKRKKQYFLMKNSSHVYNVLFIFLEISCKWTLRE